MATAPKAQTGNQVAEKEVLLRVEGVTKIYDGSVKAVDDVSLNVTKGEIFGLLGGSGWAWWYISCMGIRRVSWQANS